MSKSLPRIGITLGDVAGIGPEVALKALAARELQGQCIPVIIGERSVVAAYAERLFPDLKIRVVSHPAEAVAGISELQLLDLKNIRFSDVALGQVSRACGSAALDFIRTGAEYCLKKELDAIATAPIHKEAVQLAGIQAPGHTEYLARLCGVKEVRMLLVVNHLRVMHLTTHLSLSDAIAAVKKERIMETIRFGAMALEQLHLPQGRMAVAALNPHAGEGGLFGKEELEEIDPAVKAAQAAGFRVVGPVPPDTIFGRMDRREFDLVIALYHDQGHIPLKLVGFDMGVNVTIGLPIIRTSVDHGTAFDIAGKLEANPSSMIQAIKLACVMAGG